MTQDFANTISRARARRRRLIPLLLAFGLGALSIAFIYQFFFDDLPEAIDPQSTTSPLVQTVEKVAAAEEPLFMEEPRFDFYQMLEHNAQIENIYEEELNLANFQSSEMFIVELATFDTITPAVDSMKAELTILGLEPKLAPTHRGREVRLFLGPYASKMGANQMKAVLEQQGIRISQIREIDASH